MSSYRLLFVSILITKVTIYLSSLNFLLGLFELISQPKWPIFFTS